MHWIFVLPGSLGPAVTLREYDRTVDVQCLMIIGFDGFCGLVMSIHHELATPPSGRTLPSLVVVGCFVLHRQSHKGVVHKGLRSQSNSNNGHVQTGPEARAGLTTPVTISCLLFLLHDPLCFA